MMGWGRGGREEVICSRRSFAAGGHLRQEGICGRRAFAAGAHLRRAGSGSRQRRQQAPRRFLPGILSPATVLVSLPLLALLLRLSACDCPERGQGKSRQDCWDAFHLLPAYQKLHHPTVTHGPKGVQMEGKGCLSQRRAMGTTPVCGHERAGQQQCQHHPVCRANSARCQTERVLSSEDPSEDDEETCTGPCRRALHGSGWWWSPWVFRE
ncbi:uncharacterized protein AAGF69_017214 [Amazona ochrocephala]